MPESEILFGVHPVLEALRAGNRTFNRICLQKGRGGKEIDLLSALAREQGIPIQPSPRERLDRIAGHGRHQGVVGFVSRKGYASLEGLLRKASDEKRVLFLIVLDGVEDPHNLGAIIRTAEAAGADGVVIPERRAAGLTSVVSKSSAGALEYLPVVRVVNLFQALEEIKRGGGWVVGLSEKGKQSYDSVDLTRPIALVLGGEGGGLRPRTVDACDELVSLPMRGKVSSLNVSVAAGVMAYEVLRQRKEKHAGAT
jgi:23S rRNA (guanosine2251-2'-O)-methyltransferase